jgi:hypothetical protein
VLLRRIALLAALRVFNHVKRDIRVAAVAGVAVPARRAPSGFSRPKRTRKARDQERTMSGPARGGRLHC